MCIHLFNVGFPLLMNRYFIKQESCLFFFFLCYKPVPVTTLGIVDPPKTFAE